MVCDIHAVLARNEPLLFEAIKNFKGGCSSSTPNYLNIYFLGSRACSGCPEAHWRLACLNPSSSVGYVQCLRHMAALDKVQGLCGLVTSSLWPQLSPMLALSSKLHSDQVISAIPRSHASLSLRAVHMLIPYLKYSTVLLINRFLNILQFSAYPASSRKPPLTPSPGEVAI